MPIVSDLLQFFEYLEGLGRAKLQSPWNHENGWTWIFSFQFRNILEIAIHEVTVSNDVMM